MAFWQIFKISRKTFFDPKSWLGYNSLAENSRSLWGTLRFLFISPAAGPAETFEEAKERLGLSDKAIRQIAQTYRYYAYGFALLGFLVFIFSFYLLFYHGTLQGWLLALAASALFFSQAFRYHFWFFQIKQHKLGYTVREWWNAIKRKEPSA